MSKYFEIRKYSQKAADFLEQFKPENYADGRYELDDQGLFVNIMTFTTKPRAEQRYEAHKKYIDVQCVLEGEEGFCLEPIADIDLATLDTPYSEELDIMFYTNETPGKYYKLTAGEFLIMGPDMAHMPGIAVESPSVVRKMVVKIPVK